MLVIYESRLRRDMSVNKFRGVVAPFIDYMVTRLCPIVLGMCAVCKRTCVGHDVWHTNHTWMTSTVCIVSAMMYGTPITHGWHLKCVLCQPWCMAHQSHMDDIYSAYYVRQPWCMAHQSHMDAIYSAYCVGHDVWHADHTRMTYAVTSIQLWMRITNQHQLHVVMLIQRWSNSFIHSPNTVSATLIGRHSSIHRRLQCGLWPSI